MLITLAPERKSLKSNDPRYKVEKVVKQVQSHTEKTGGDGNLKVTEKPQGLPGVSAA